MISKWVSNIVQKTLSSKAGEEEEANCKSHVWSIIHQEVMWSTRTSHTRVNYSCAISLR